MLKIEFFQVREQKIGIPPHTYPDGYGSLQIVLPKAVRKIILNQDFTSFLSTEPFCQLTL